jgi:hypothetical protein
LKRLGLTALLLALFALHQDAWFWRTAHPLAFGLLPPGLWYHVIYTLALIPLAVLLVRYYWPRHLEDVSGEEPKA